MEPSTLEMLSPGMSMSTAQETLSTYQYNTVVKSVNLRFRGNNYKIQTYPKHVGTQSGYGVPSCRPGQMTAEGLCPSAPRSVAGGYRTGSYLVMIYKMSSFQGGGSAMYQLHVWGYIQSGEYMSQGGAELSSQFQYRMNTAINTYSN